MPPQILRRARSRLLRRRSDPVKRVPRRWGDLKDYIADYQSWDSSFKKILEQRGSIVITGPAGIGKTTFLVWAIGSALEGEINHWGLKDVVFLDRERFSDLTENSEELQLSPNTTLLVVDAPFTLDTPSSRKVKVDTLVRLARHFSVIITMRDDEYQSEYEGHTRIATMLSGAHFQEFKLSSDQFRFWEILQKRLLAWGNAELASQVHSEMQDLLQHKSEGLPIYLQLLVEELYERRELTTLSIERFEQQLRDLPQGMTNFIWQILHRIAAGGSNCDALLLILALLEKCDTTLSCVFLERAVAAWAHDGQKREAQSLEQLERLKRYLLENQSRRDPREIARAFPFYKLSPHWRAALSTPPPNTAFRAMANRYRQIRTDTEDIKETVCNRLWSANIASVRDALLASDLIKLGYGRAVDVTNEWLRARTGGALKDYRKELDTLFFDVWVSRAYAAKDSAATEPSIAQEAIKSFETALKVSEVFDSEHRLKEEKKPLHAYAVFRRKIVLSSKKELADYRREAYKITSLYDRLIGLDERDPRSWQSKGVFHGFIREFDEAEKCFKRALIDAQVSGNPTEEIAIRLAYGTCLRDWGISVESGQPEQAHQKINDAIDQLQRAWQVLQKEKKWKDLSLNGAMLLARYGEIRGRIAKKTKEKKRKVEQNRQTQQFYIDYIAEYPNQLYVRNDYSNFLLKACRFLSEDSNSQPFIEEAKRQLEESFKIAEKQKANPATHYHTLGRLHYIWQEPPAFEDAEQCLKSSLDSKSPFQRAITHHELAKLYLKWAERYEDGKLERNKFLDNASEEFRQASLFESPTHQVSLSKTAIRLCFVAKDFAGARKRMDKLVEWKRGVQGPGRSESVYTILENLGDHLFVQKNFKAASVCFMRAFFELQKEAWLTGQNIDSMPQLVKKVVEAYLKATAGMESTKAREITTRAQRVAFLAIQKWPSNRGWWLACKCADLMNQFSEVITAYEKWLECIRNLTLEQQCKIEAWDVHGILRWAFNAYHRLAFDIIEPINKRGAKTSVNSECVQLAADYSRKAAVAGRYFATLNHVLGQNNPQQWYWKVGTGVRHEYPWSFECLVNQFRLDKGANKEIKSILVLKVLVLLAPAISELSLTAEASWANDLRRTILDEINDVRPLSYQNLAQRILEGAVSPVLLSDVRLLADGLFFGGNVELTQRVWNWIRAQSVFPDNFFAGVIARSLQKQDSEHSITA